MNNEKIYAPFVKWNHLYNELTKKQKEEGDEAGLNFFNDLMKELFTKLALSEEPKIGGHMSKPDSEFKARQIPSIKEQMDKPQFELSPEWSEDEYMLASAIWTIFKSESGTSGKKKAIHQIREFIERR